MHIPEIHKLRKWFLLQRRDLPWREHPSPYAVWVSEVMLQQTQVAVVIPYFERWMNLFPTLQDLAAAPLEKVIKEWEGLGYYSRARNLHEGARYVIQHHQGELPSIAEDLKKIKGLGDYTIGAILSFAFHQKSPAVDGNVIRTLARYYAFSENVSQQKSIKKIRQIAHDLLPDEDPWIISEALIELGATICGRNPKCLECPLRKSCRAFSLGIVDKLPVKSAKKAITPLYRSVAVAYHDDHLLVRCGEKGKLMSDLYEFPYFELDSPLPAQDLQERLESEWTLKVTCKQTLPEVRHSFTRYRALLFPQLFFARHAIPVKGYTWLSLSKLQTLAFSSGHRRIFNNLLQILPQFVKETAL